MKFRSPFAILTLLLLSACATPDPVQKFPDLTFKHLPPISLRVADFQLVNADASGTQQPEVGHTFPVPPERALKNWAEDRLQLAATDGTVRFTILKASVREEKLATDRGIKGVFTQEQSEKYNAVVMARIDVSDAAGVVRASADAEATRSITVREDMSITERRAVWFKLIEKLMGDFNAEMENSIAQHLTEFRL